MSFKSRSARSSACEWLHLNSIHDNMVAVSLLLPHFPFSSRLSDHFFLPPALSSPLLHLICLLGPKTIGFGTNQDSRIIDCMGFVDRHSTFYSFFIVWLTGTMDSIKSAKLLSKTIETIRHNKNIKTIGCAVPVNKNYKINAPGILVGPKSYGFGTTRSRDTRHLPNQ